MHKHPISQQGRGGADQMISESSWHTVRNITQISADEISADVVVPPESPWFCGHFPGDPVLPALAQLDIVSDIAGYLKQIRVIGIKRVRFRRIIRPDEKMTVSLAVSGKQPLAASYKLTVNDGIASSGILLIEEKTDDDNG